LDKYASQEEHRMSISVEINKESQDHSSLNEIGQIAVRVSDLDRALKFYRDNLGLPFLFQVPGMAFFDCAGVRLLLGLPENGEAKKENSIIYFRVTDIDATKQAMEDRGTIFTSVPHLVARMEDHDLWMAFFEDSEGNTMALMSEVPHTAG
jgi:predicted enzyme related to lactoylglutathione lyase